MDAGTTLGSRSPPGETVIDNSPDVSDVCTDIDETLSDVSSITMSDPVL